MTLEYGPAHLGDIGVRDPEPVNDPFDWRYDVYAEKQIVIATHILDKEPMPTASELIPVRPGKPVIVSSVSTFRDGPCHDCLTVWEVS